MPKVKTKRAANKRFKATASGKIKRGRQNHRHLLERKSTKMKKRAVKSAYVDKTFEKQVKRMLPYL